MLHFESKEFQKNLVDAISALEKRGQREVIELEDFIDPTAADFDPNDYGEMTIGLSSEMSFSLPRTEFSKTMTYEEFIGVVRDIEKLELCDHVECWTKTSLLLRVEFLAADDPGGFFHLLNDSGKAFNIETRYGSETYCCCVVSGITPFGIAVAMEGNYEKYFPPATYEDLFVEIKGSEFSMPDSMRAAAEAYLFELSATGRVTLQPSPRPDISDDDESDLGNAKQYLQPKLRPLLFGKGMHEITSLYNTGARSVDPAIQILFYVKVLEFISVTVIRQKLNDVIRAKLVSSRALKPDADFIRELELAYDENRRLRTDREALKLTVQECCDPIELKLYATPFLNKLRSLSLDARPVEREEALREFGEVLSSTRNMIAHSKPSYTPTEAECPKDQLEKFAVCARIAAEQTIRWYHSRHEDMRIT